MAATEPRIPAATPWERRRETGHDGWLRIAEAVARLFGRRTVHALLVLAAVYFAMLRPEERRVSREFLSRALGRPAGIADCVRQFHAFARVTVDRVFLLSPQARALPLQMTGEAPLAEAVRRGRGGILLGAHFGSFEAARQAGLAHSTMRLHLLLDRAVHRGFVRTFERIDPTLVADVLDASGDAMTLALRIGECLRAGEWVGWLGDRPRADERSVRVPFMGGTARFPAGPFIIAHLFQVPVFLVLAPLEGDRYHLAVEQLAGEAELAMRDRDAFVAAQVSKYAQRLEAHVRESPSNWFNFHDVWSA